MKRPFRHHEGRNLIIISDLCLRIRDLQTHIEQFINLTKFDAMENAPFGKSIVVDKQSSQKMISPENT